MEARIEYHESNRCIVSFGILCLAAAAMCGCTLEHITGFVDSFDTDAGTERDTSDEPEGNDPDLKDTDGNTTDPLDDTDLENRWFPRCPGAMEILLMTPYPISEEESGCIWDIPSVLNLEELNYDEINLVYGQGIGGGSGARKVIGHVVDGEYCSRVMDGWYYDNPASPARISACDQTCTMIEEQLTSLLRLEIGCPTELATFTEEQ